MSSRFFLHAILRSVLVVVTLILFTACSAVEPITIAGFTLNHQSQPVPRDKTEPVCKAIEKAGYVMPYGPSLPWSFEMSQPQWTLSGPGGLQLTIPDGHPTLYVMVDWRIPADLEAMGGDIVSQQTVDQLAGEAKKVCRIVQQEAAKQDIGPVDVRIRLWDLIVGTELEYGPPDAAHRDGTQYTSDCDRLIGSFEAKSIGLNPSEPVPDHCPSLYVSAFSMSYIRMGQAVESRRDTGH